MSDTYNGYTNWATWNMELWMDNDPSIYNERVHLWPRICGFSPGMKAKFLCLKHFPNGTPDMKRSDLVLINWEEIGSNWDIDNAEREKLEVK